MLSNMPTLELLEELHSAIIEANKLWDNIESNLVVEKTLKLAA